MAAGKDSESHEESTESGKTSNVESSAELEEQTTHHDFTSSAAILEPSENDPLFKRENIKLRTYKAIMRSFNSTEIYENSEESQNDVESGQQQISGCLSFCANLLNGYKDFACRLRNSKFVYILQFLLIMLYLSSIVMGKEYTKSCPGSPSLIDFATFTGLFALALIVMWILIRFCCGDDKDCVGYTKFFILVIFVLVSILLMLEIGLFVQLSPSFKPSTTNYCNKIFYDYTYYKFIAAVVSIFLVVLLYIPDYVRLASDVTCTNPAASCYSGMEEDS